MQTVLTFTHKKKKYVSKPWNFHAAVMIEKEYLKLEEGEKVDPVILCGEAVDYLFEGTEATSEILDSAVSAKMRMCREIWKRYLDDFTGKNDESLQTEQAEEQEN